ncbi:GNAT family N-acetyltransferase [Candidatus Pacearchaeota archaeon]|nr:GNAT family N-acetyltransferase [Candidatus Pacearchaeota archaeon]
MKIRELELNDKPNWIRLVKLADNRDYLWAKQKFDSYVLSKKKKRLVIVEENDNLIGFAGIKGEDIEENVKSELIKEYLLITWIAFIPEFRNKGLGSKLLTVCEKYAKKWKKKGIWLGCRDEVIPFYEKNKYKKIGMFINNGEKEENLIVKVFTN